VEEGLKGWMAGFFEGEGSIAIGKGHFENWRHPQYALQIVVSSSDLNRLNRLYDNFQGYIYARKPRGQDKRGLYYRKPAYQWILHGAKASDFLKEILPYLAQTSQAEVAIEFQKTIGVKVTAGIRKQREELYNKMKSLNLQQGKGRG